MSRFRHRHHDDTEAALANFALTFAKALLVFCVVLFVMISPEAKKDDGIKPKMEYLLSVDWDGNLDYDVDLWLADPEGKILYYGNKEVGLLNLERDDMGVRNDTMTVDGVAQTIKINQELLAVRGIKPGEYVVNVHLYRADTYSAESPVAPFGVTLRLDKLNPTIRTVYRAPVTLSKVTEEVHAFRFTLTSDGEVTNLTTTLPQMLRERIRPSAASENQ